MSIRRSGAAVLLATLAVLVPSAQAGAQSPSAEAAVEALETAKDLSNGEGVRTGRELTLALAELARRRPALSRTRQRQADGILARPTDPSDFDRYDVPAVSDCTAHFCIHWVETTEDAPDLTDTDADDVPDYVEEMQAAFEDAYQVENVDLGWREALPDGVRGGNALLDVYIAQIGDEDLYGYAAPETPGPNRTATAYQVMDDDYALSEFGYADPSVPMRVTAAHEYNHILQFAYDTAQDDWMYESTATWMEEKVFPADDDWHFYMTGWASRPFQPITSAGDGVAPFADDRKMYGSAVWNHWLDGRYDADTVRDAWAHSVATSVDGRGYAPAAYDAAIRAADPTSSFGSEFQQFAAATAEWGGIADGAELPDVLRSEDLQPEAPATTATVDHTGFDLYDVPVPGPEVERLDLAGSLPVGISGSFALVGYDGVDQQRVVGPLPTGGPTVVSLPDPSTFERITAVVVNSDTANAGYETSCGDWNWSHDGQEAVFQVAGRAAADPPIAAPAPSAKETTTCLPPEPSPTPTSTPTPTPTASPTPSPTVVPTPTPTVEPRDPTSVRLSRATTRFRTASLRGRFEFVVNTNKTGRLSARATVDRKTAKRLRMGRKRTFGTLTAAVTRTGPIKVAMKLSRKLRKALKRQKKAAKVTVRGTYVPSDGTPAVSRTLSVRLKR